MKSPLWQLTHPHVVYGHIAHALLHTPTVSAAPLGNIVLHDHQRDAAERITRAIAQHGGALLADSVGLGKTFVALAVASEYEHTHILAPATLLPMWRQAIAEARLSNVSLHSLQTLSRRPLPPCPHASRCLMVVDEAHHLRTRNTIRYRNAAQFVANRALLLLSATPIHNKPRDLRNLLALFLGHRADALDHASLAQLIVRRTHAVANNQSIAHRIPIVREHTPFRLPENPPVLESLLALPAPLPTKDGAAAGALIRLGLLRAWCSSDAALTDTLRRRQLRGEAMLHSLTNGRYPTQRELQSWIVGNDSIQLGFSELLVADANADTSTLITTLSTHLAALDALLQLHTRLAHADPERASILRTLLNPQHATDAARLLTTSTPAASSSQATPPIVAFSHFASTVHALHRALNDIAGVASLTSHGGKIASGAITRQELIAHFAPVANGRPPPPAHQAIRLLLTTDLLAEGVNLQDAGTLVHLDLPWTDAAREQRVGRLARIGSRHHAVNVFTFAPPPGIDTTLKLVATLERKARLATNIIGSVNPFFSLHRKPESESAAETATRLHNTLQQWSRLAQQRTDAVSPTPCACNRTPMLSAVTSAAPGFIAIVSHNHNLRAIAKFGHQIGDSIPHLMRTIDAIDAHAPPLTEATQTLTTANRTSCTPLRSEDEPLLALFDSAISDLTEWHDNQELAATTGPATRALSDAHKSALRTLAHSVANTPALARAALVAAAAKAELRVLGARGAGAEVALEQWRQCATLLTPRRWLDAIDEYPALDSVRTSALTNTPSSLNWQLHAILLLIC